MVTSSGGGSSPAIDATLRYVAGVLGVNTTQPNANQWNALQTFADGFVASGGQASIVGGAGDSVFVQAGTGASVQIQDPNKNTLVEAGPAANALQLGNDIAGAKTTYLGGSIVPPQVRTAGFTFGDSGKLTSRSILLALLVRSTLLTLQVHSIRF